MEPEPPESRNVFPERLSGACSALSQAPGGYAGGMERRTSERGNTLLVATALVLGMTMLSLGAAKFLREQTSLAMELRLAGYPSAQALYAAEMGINALLYENNTRAEFSEAPTVPEPKQWTRSIAYPGGAIAQQVAYRITPLGPVSAGVYGFEATGEATPLQGGWATIARTIRFDVATGSVWVLRRYEQK